MPRVRGGTGRRNGVSNMQGAYAGDQFIPSHHHQQHHQNNRRRRGRRGRQNFSSAAIRRMVLTSSANKNQESIAIMSSYYHRFLDGSDYHDGHSFWSFERRGQMLNDCFVGYSRTSMGRKGRFNLGVHTRRLLAVTELANEFMVPRSFGGRSFNVVIPNHLEHSIINTDINDMEDEDDA